jgi:uncharacterized membrane protein YgcG
VSFRDPFEERTWVFDVTFLLSGWNCIYRAGCQGVLTGPAPELEQGCCSYGAHFTDSDDQARVVAAAARLTAEQWQFRNRGRRGGTMRTDAEGASVTRLVDGACIFLNRPGFPLPGGAGCALHRAALEAGQRPMDWKPDVCWQLPLRRQDSTDEWGHVTSTVTQWDRRHWGDGGGEFHWWCTEAPEAFGAATPVYRSLADELIGLCGATVYQQVAGYLDSRSGTGGRAAGAAGAGGSGGSGAGGGDGSGGSGGSGGGGGSGCSGGSAGWVPLPHPAIRSRT